MCERICTQAHVPRFMRYTRRRSLLNNVLTPNERIRVEV